MPFDLAALLADHHGEAFGLHKEFLNPQLAKILEILGFDRNNFHAHELGEFEQLAVFLLVETRTIDAEGIGGETVGVQDGFLAQAFRARCGGVEMSGDELDLFQAVFGGEVDDLIEGHIAAGPRLQAEFRAGRSGDGTSTEKRCGANEGKKETKFHDGSG